MKDYLKKFSTIGCCGIDCGLCPRFYTKGSSACPGCGGLNFKEKHPSCGFLTCSVIKKGLEVCADCNDYPCSRFDSESEGFDSFVTHRNVFPNLDSIQKNGIAPFLDQQKIRIDILNFFLAHYDDGRSKSYYCICCTLLPLDELQKIKMSGFENITDLKERSVQIKAMLSSLAKELNINLKLNFKK